MVALPTAMAVTLPLASTVAILLLLVDHLTVLSVAFSGSTVADRVAVSVAFSDSVVLSNDTDAAGVCVTVTLHLAEYEPHLAVIVVIPALTPFTSPLASTVAIDV